MKENYTQLYPNEQVATAVGDYAYEHSTKLPKHITDHHAWGVANHEKANYMISPLQAQFQIWMAKAVGAKRVLEIGTFIGFSTMCWAHAVGPQGHITTLEFSPSYASLASSAFTKNNLANIDILTGDARDTLRTLAENLQEPFDLVFIDADKTSYPTYLSLLLSLSSPGSTARLLRKPPPHPALACGLKDEVVMGIDEYAGPGATILADNILRRGLIADSSPANPWSERLKEKLWQDGDMKALDEFNKALVSSERIETFLMPMFDGLGCGLLVD